jgi:hypothetical protein
MKTDEKIISIFVLNHEVILSPVCNEEVKAVKSGTSIKKAGDRICFSFETPNREQAHQQCSRTKSASLV